MKNRKNIDYQHILEKAISWIEKYTINKSGIAVSSARSNIIYPEVSGYIIPSLLLWGKRSEAIQFANYLISVQNPNGYWNAPCSKTAYTFDTGQIIKGLMSLVGEKPEYKKNIIRGLDWIVTQQREDGSIATPDYSSWRLPGKNILPESVHLYILEPFKIAVSKWKSPIYKKFLKKALKYYLNKSGLTNFNTLSHFHAYIIESLIDLGQTKRAQKAMENIARHQQHNGSIPAYPNVGFICSPGLFQYAVCWYKLNDLVKGNKAFDYAVRLQNKSGGWFGSYGKQANYFPKEEISWAIKYFLDALYWKIRCEFNNMANIFPKDIEASDGRYVFIEKEILNKKNYKVLDVGCGKGRFISKLKKRNSNIDAYGIDISENILKSVPSKIKTNCGSLLSIPYPDNIFDLCFCVEALEHSIYIQGAIKEMVRVVKPNGKVIIIDKNIHKMGCMEISEWETWFDAKKLTKIMVNQGLSVTYNINIPYEKDGRSDNLFIGWLGIKHL